MSQLGKLCFLLLLALVATGTPQVMHRVLEAVSSEEPEAGGEAFLAIPDLRSRQFLIDAASSPGAMSPIMGDMIAALTAGPEGGLFVKVARLYSQAYGFYRLNAGLVVQCVWILFAAILIMAGVALLLDWRDECRTITLSCYYIAQIFLLALSAFVVMTFIVFQLNLWDMTPPALWAVPVISLLGCAGIMRAMDVNFPFWNTVLMSFATPLLACLIMFLWAGGLEAVRRIYRI